MLHLPNLNTGKTSSFSFSWHRVCLWHLIGVRPSVPSSVSLFFVLLDVFHHQDFFKCLQLFLCYLSIRPFCYVLSLSISYPIKVISFAFGCSLVFVLSPSTRWYNFLSLFWQVLFCLYCLVLSRYLLNFPCFATIF